MVPSGLTKLGLGAIIWWSLPGDIDTNKVDWPTRFPDFPLPQEPLGDPLRRALFALEAPVGSKRLVRPLKVKDHWAVVIETPTEDDLTYSTEFTVKLTPFGLEFVKKSLNSDSWAYMLEQNYNQELQRVTSAAVADLILNYVRATCLAVQARKTGGVYFVPADRGLNLEKIVQLVEGLYGRLYYFPVEDEKRHRDDLLNLIVEDLKAAKANVEMNIAARHKGDAVKEGKLALDRVRFYAQALGLVTNEAATIEKEINDMLVIAMTKKEKKEVK